VYKKQQFFSRNAVLYLKVVPGTVLTPSRKATNRLEV
jgi:hypothetical protein